MVRHAAGDETIEFAGVPEPLTGGFWAQLVSFRLRGAPPGWDRPLVARVMPDQGTAAKETAFQRAIAAAGYPTPSVHAAGGPDEGIVGQSYVVMDLASGRPLLAGLDGVRALLRLPSLARRLPKTLARALAELHALDPADVIAELDAAGEPRPTVPAMVCGLREAAAALGRADLAAAASWFEEHPAADEPVRLCHGDLHPFNVLVDENDMITVLDWSAALLAPASHDLAFTSLLLAEPPLVVPPPLRPVVGRAGRALSNRFVAEYERAAGRTVDRDAVAWHQGLVCLRALVEVAGWVAAGTIDARAGHPWLISGGPLARRLTALTSVPVAAR